MNASIRILFIDDSEDDVWVLLQEIRKANYVPDYERVFTPSAMEQALAQGEWDVIICDYQMPRFNAPAALRILQQSELDIPFIVVSGAIVEETGIAVMRAGAHDYVMKDNLARLVPAIEREIAEAANRRERRKAEKRALRLGQILDNSSNEIYVFEFQSRTFIQVNRSACENLGYTADELSEMNLLNLQPELTPQQLVAHLNALLNEQDEITFETSHCRKNGTMYPVEVHLHRSRSEFPPVFIAVVRDITERKLAEEALKVTLDKITDLYRISRSIGTMRTIDDILSTLLNSQYLNVSEAVVLLFDKPDEPDLSEYHRIHTVVRREDASSNTNSYALPFSTYPAVHLVSGNSSVVIEDVQLDKRLSLEVRDQLTNANIQRMMLFPLRNSSSWYGALALHFANGKHWNSLDVRHMEGLVDQVLIAIDNIFLLSSEAEARAEAERANQLKMRFLAMISHELRTPLTTIKGFSTTLLADDVVWETDQQKRFLTIVDQETDKLTDLIEQLLDLSRLQAGTLRIAPKPLAFQQVLDEAMVHLNVLTTNHRLIIQTEAHLPALNVDSQRIAQVLENLVANSVKYSPPSTDIRLTAKSIGNRLQVDVTDQGIGIPLSEHKHIFDAFHQIARHNNAGGAGLGLAICKGLIEAHGGNIWIQETNASGTTISFSLPLALST